MYPANRPLSPHLQVYRLPLLALLSISHRITGVAMFVAALFLVYWLAALAAGPSAFEAAQDFFGNLVIQLILFLATYGLFYHLCNGIRHLFWDAGMGFEIEVAERSGKSVLIAAGALTALIWLIVLL
jgi:succinate dehydrogenase / fumarate reductase cytochrome b subunit